MADVMLQIGEVAQRAALSLRTVRYYEETGLLEPARRTSGGFRLYTTEHVDRLLLIKRMKPLGFSLQQMRELLDARDTLHSLDGDEEARDAARARVAEYAVVASRACDGLREQLAAGDGFVTLLRRESQPSRIAAGRD